MTDYHRFKMSLAEALDAVQTGDTKAREKIVSVCEALLRDNDELRRKLYQQETEAIPTPDERIKRLLTWATEQGYQLDLVRIGDVEMKAPYFMAEQPSALIEQKIRIEVTNYYDAINRHEHGGVAMGKAFHEIERILGLDWGTYKRDREREEGVGEKEKLCTYCGKPFRRVEDGRCASCGEPSK